MTVYRVGYIQLEVIAAEANPVQQINMRGEQGSEPLENN